MFFWKDVNLFPEKNKKRVRWDGRKGERTMRQTEQLIHPLDPVFSEQSEILILGSFPSEASRSAGFYYGNPRNRFWATVATVFGEAVPGTTEERRELILRNRLALWDVIASCTIRGSADSEIGDVVPNDLSVILRAAPVRRILINGKTAERYYRKFQLPVTRIEPIVLPSTSPANAAWSGERLAGVWGRALKE